MNNMLFSEPYFISTRSCPMGQTTKYFRFPHHHHTKTYQIRIVPVREKIPHAYSYIC